MSATPDAAIAETVAERLRSAMRGMIGDGEAGKGEDVGRAGAPAPIDRGASDAAVTAAEPKPTEPGPAPAVRGGEGGADASAGTEDDAGADFDDAGVDPTLVDGGTAGASGGEGAAGASGVGGEAVAGAGGEAVAGAGGEAAAGAGGEAAAGAGGEAAAGAGGEAAAGAGGEAAAGAGGEAAAGAGGEAAAGVGGEAAAGVGGEAAAGSGGEGAAGMAAGSGRDRELLLGLLDLVITVLQNDSEAEPGDLLTVLASAPAADPAVLGRVLSFVDGAQNCDRRSDPCVRVCELAASRCERCTEDASCRAALRGTCGFEATECAEEE